MKLLRTLGLMLAVVFAVAMLATCGGDDEKDSGAAATTRAAASPTGGDGAGGGSVDLEIAAENIAYDLSELSAPAGAAVTLTFDNDDDTSTQHNWSLYESEDSDTAIFEGEIIGGGETVDYEFTAPEDPGTYHFHCDIHPTQMTGDFIVE